MMGAATAATGATGLRAWLGTRSFDWLTPLRLKRITAALLGAALIASSVSVGGNHSPSDATDGPKSAVEQR